jgi:DNA-binding NtrC family response regulator
MAADILIIDDDRNMRKGLRLTLEKKYSVIAAENGKEGIDIFEREEPDLVLLDIGLPDISGMDVLKKIKIQKQDTMVIMVTAEEGLKSIVNSIKKGAYDYLVKPVGRSELLLTVKNALEKKQLKAQIRSIQSPLIEKYRFGFIGKDKKIRKMIRTARKISKSTDTPTLIVGESGTGKGMLARTIHYSSSQTPGPFIVINCGAISKDLVESELFGYEGGAFTGARAVGKKGRFEEASGGTLFLDEIGAMPMSAQAKLLHVLEERTFFKVGGTKPIPLLARVISATNADIENAILNGGFRKDLFYRINAVMLALPPLRDRYDDILPLAKHFMTFYNNKFGKTFSSLALETERIFLQYNWPGNVRELKNTIERITLLEEGDIILPEYLPFSTEKNSGKGGKGKFDIIGAKESYHENLRTIIKNALDQTDNNMQKAALLLNLPVHTLRYQMKKSGIKIINR